MAKGTIEELEKELNLMKETQAGFRSDNSKSCQNFELAYGEYHLEN